MLLISNWWLHRPAARRTRIGFSLMHNSNKTRVVLCIAPLSLLDLVGTSSLPFWRHVHSSGMCHILVHCHQVQSLPIRIEPIRWHPLPVTSPSSTVSWGLNLQFLVLMCAPWPEQFSLPLAWLNYLPSITGHNSATVCPGWTTRH